MTPLTAINSLIQCAPDQVTCMAVPMRFNADGTKNLFAAHPPWPQEQDRPTKVAKAIQDGWALGVFPKALGALVMDVDVKRPTPFAEQIQAVEALLGHPAAFVRGTSSGGTHQWYVKGQDLQAPSVVLMGELRVDVKTTGYVLWHPSDHMWVGLNSLVYHLAEATPFAQWPGQVDQTKSSTQRNMQEVNLKAVGRCLRHARMDLGYDEWVKCGMALHSVNPSDEAAQVWASATRRTSRDSFINAYNRWKEFTANGAVTFGTLVAICKKYGADYNAEAHKSRQGAALKRF